MYRPRIRMNQLLIEVPLLLLLASAAPAPAQDLPKPPDFSQPAIASAAEKADAAWKAWIRGDRDLEREIFRLPMGEARSRLQRSLSAFIAYLDTRKDYADRVGSYIENYRPETARGAPVVGIEPVNRDELELLGQCIANLQSRLDNLRDSSDWPAIRRAVQSDRSDALDLQNKRRDEIPVELPLSRPQAPRPLSAIVYRDSERQLREVTQKLWTHYYQAVADAVEQKPSGSKALISSAVVPQSESEPAPAAASPASGGLEKLVGAWEYAERSQQFNGVEEPHQVLLELSIEKGSLIGRYRASLSDFDGMRQVDLHLVMMKAPKGSRDLTFNVKTGGADVSGQLKIEAPDEKVSELVLVHVGVDGVPRGRETLVRR